MGEVFVELILGVEEVIVAAMPIGDIEVTLVDGYFSLFKALAKTVAVLTADCITETFRFIGSERFGEVAIDLSVKSATVFLHTEDEFDEYLSQVNGMRFGG